MAADGAIRISGSGERAPASTFQSRRTGGAADPYELYQAWTVEQDGRARVLLGVELAARAERLAAGQALLADEELDWGCHRAGHPRIGSFTGTGPTLAARRKRAERK